MKWEVKLYVGGQVFAEEVRAVNMKDARETALARNPKAKVISVNASFLWFDSLYGPLKCPNSEGVELVPSTKGEAPLDRSPH